MLYTKYLGILIDENLSWKQHINYTINKLSKGIGIMKILRKYCNINTLKLIYYSVIYPYLLYGINSWGCAYPSHLNSLQSKQNIIVRIMLSKAPRTTSRPLYFSSLALLPLPHHSVSAFCFV